MILCKTSTTFGFHILLQALDTLPPTETRVLLVSSDTIDDPEAGSDTLEYIRSQPAAKQVFSDVIDLNRLLSPIHPRHWEAPNDTMASRSLQSILTHAFGDEPVTTLLMESIQVAPSKTLGQVFHDARVHIYSDGLMTFSPTRSRLPESLLSRIDVLHYPDIVAGVEPPLLREASVALRPIPVERLKCAFGVRIPMDPAENFDGIPLFLGQYLGALNLLTPQEEAALYAEGIAAAARKGGSRVVAFKPHPSFAEGLIDGILANPALAGLEVRVVRSRTLLEVLLMAARPSLVASVFSTGAATASALHGIPAYSFRARHFFGRLAPWENGNRAPVMLSALMFPDLESGELGLSDPKQLQLKVDLLAASMQPGLLVENTAIQRALLLTEPGAFDPIEGEARRILARWRPPQSFSAVAAAMSGASWEASLVETEPLRDIELSMAALYAHDYARAFDISIRALQKTPTSTKHMNALRKAAEHLTQLHRNKAAEVLAHAQEQRILLTRKADKVANEFGAAKAETIDVSGREAAAGHAIGLIPAE
jgi:hypothetical protein